MTKSELTENLFVVAGDDGFLADDFWASEVQGATLYYSRRHAEIAAEREGGQVVPVTRTCTLVLGFE